MQTVEMAPNVAAICKIQNIKIKKQAHTKKNASPTMAVTSNPHTNKRTKRCTLDSVLCIGIHSSLIQIE